MNTNNNTRPSTSNIWTPLTPARYYRPSELFTTFAPTRINIDNLTPVIVRPTREQILNATETISIEEASGNTCPITQSPFQESDVITRIRHCGHTFAEVSLHTWFERSVICPVCRYDIRDYVPNESLTNNSNSNHHNIEPILESRHEPSPDPSRESSPEPRDNIMIPEPNTENPARGIIHPGAHNNTHDIENMVNMFANNLSNSLREYATNNASNSNDDQGRIHFEYVIQTPTNTYTSSNSPTNSNTLNNLLFTPLMNNTNERITNNNANNGNSTSNGNSANNGNSTSNGNSANNGNSASNGNSANSESSDDNVSDIENDDVNEAWNNDPF